MNNVIIRFLVAMTCLVGSSVYAQDVAPDPTLLTSCAVCHGEAGISPSDDWPHLAGQQAAYLVQEMRAYRDGSRVNAEMNALSTVLTDEQINLLADHYAAFPAATADFSDLSEAAQEGLNDAATCRACHGMEGVSVVDIWPNLAGQTPTYIAAQLRAFRDGTRVDPIMSERAVVLSDEQIDSIATFFSELSYE